MQRDELLRGPARARHADLLPEHRPHRELPPAPGARHPDPGRAREQRVGRASAAGSCAGVEHARDDAGSPRPPPRSAATSRPRTRRRAAPVRAGLRPSSTPRGSRASRASRARSAQSYGSRYGEDHAGATVRDRRRARRRRARRRGRSRADPAASVDAALCRRPARGRSRREAVARHVAVDASYWPARPGRSRARCRPRRPRQPGSTPSRREVTLVRCARSGRAARRSASTGRRPGRRPAPVCAEIRPRSGFASSSLIIGRIAANVGHQPRTSQGLLTRIPIRKTTKSPSTSAVYGADEDLGHRALLGSQLAVRALRPGTFASQRPFPTGRACEHVFAHVRRAPRPLRLLVPRRRLAARRAGGRRGRARATGRRADRPQRGLAARWSSPRRPKALGLQAIHGAEVDLDDGRHLTLLVEDAEGWRNLCRILTRAHAHTRDHGEPPPSVPLETSRRTPRAWCA